MADFSSLREAAAHEGIELRVASGFRSYERQLSIWNAKAQGLRPVLDEVGRPLNLDRLSEKEQVYAILRWSALPGASRHHWGTDLDIYDGAAIDSGYELQLTCEEYGEGGPFERLQTWLSGLIENGRAYGFVQVYGVDRGGVAPEPWHISYAPLAREYQQCFTKEQLESLVCEADIEFRETILANLDDIYQRFVVVPSGAYQ